MSILQHNRVASLSLLLSPKFGGGSGTRRVSASLTASSLSSLPSCPTLSAVVSPERDSDVSKRGRVASAPYVGRKGDPTATGHREAHEGHCHNLHSSKLVLLQAALSSRPLSVTPSPHKQATHDFLAIGEDSSELPPSTHHEVDKRMPKAPQLSFRSPTSQPRMLPLQSGFYAPVSMAKSALAPKISYTVVSEPVNAPPLHSTSHAATIAAVLEPHRRSPAPESRPILRLALSTEDEHVFSVHLPGFTPEMVTICARREDKLAVVADLWHAETNCHHEWLVAFSPRDANVLQTRAQFSADGTLTIHVPRHNGNALRMRSRLC